MTPAQPLLPPRQHGLRARELAAHAGTGNLWLPVCADCGRASYPPREICGYCLSGEMPLRPVATGATLVAVATLHHTNAEFFRASLPIRIGSVRLDAGPIAIVFLQAGAPAPGARVEVALRTDSGGGVVLVASGCEDRHRQAG